MSKPKNFTENGALRKSYNDSLFEGLFRDRKKVIESFPKVGAPLAIPDIAVKCGDANYTFKLTDTVDKLTCDSKDISVRARLKKSTDNWDVLCTPKMKKVAGVEDLALTPAIKYTSKAGKVSYVAGCGLSYKPYGIDYHLKYNPFTQNFKTSMMYNCTYTYMKIGADLKTNLGGNFKDCKYQAGCAYNLPQKLGLLSLAMNQNKDITFTYVHACTKATKCCAEVVRKGKDSKFAFCGGLATQIDDLHEVRARVNDDMQLNIAVKKLFSGRFSLQFATLFDMKNPEMKIPALGIKVDTK